MRSDRLISILTILSEHRRVSAQSLAERFEVSLRTIYRDLDTLALSGVPITAVPGTGGGYEIMPGYKADRRTFSPAELTSLMTALNGLSGVMPRETLLHTMIKVSGLIPPEQAETIRTNSDRLQIDWRPWSEGDHLKPLYDTIRSALENDHPLAFDYLSLRSGISAREVEPCRLILKGSHWYLYAYCRKHRDGRLFRLSRMDHLRMLPETFTPRILPEPILDYEKEFAAMQSDILLRVQPSALDRVLEHCSFGRVEKDGDSYLVRFPFIENDYYLDQLLSFGAGCECIGPPRVRDLIRRRLRVLSGIYGS